MSQPDSEKSATHDETVDAMPTRQNDDGDKLEEFEKLLQSITASRSPSEEEERVDDEEDNINEKRLGRWAILFTVLSLLINL